jgi:hypothetical protein
MLFASVERKKLEEQQNEKSRAGVHLGHARLHSYVLFPRTAGSFQHRSGRPPMANRKPVCRTGIRRIDTANSDGKEPLPR